MNEQEEVFKDLLNRQITIIVEGLQKPVGGVLVSFDYAFLVLETNTGNTVRIPHGKVASILTRTEGSNNGDKTR